MIRCNGDKNKLFQKEGQLFGNGIPRHSFIYRYSITWIQNNDTNFANQNKLFKLK